MKKGFLSWGFTPGERRAVILICAAVIVGTVYRYYQQSSLPSTVELNAEDSAAVESIRLAFERSSSADHTVVYNDTLVEGGLIELNTATRYQLENLPGIGPVLAERILMARDASGGFSKIEDLLQVKGIGPKRFEKIKPLVLCFSENQDK
ncbi:hypothetical protein CEE37_05415 [candidate division LCP-89 bacterium B3_LCP]|uniref:Helix-hairpin-helix DNA-binding motif class 1 domain-containing protein n=1 Tax=candidate division LCP-89 bacterium B3_LCP TaxID=2012998 RepID=A0A532V289_UNCL8|nr:MAG: hypothetical protein CEE37_05415 [candidate division LCP-89 bacterium B3_LCP]